MYDPFDIALEKTDFRLGEAKGGGLELIRWGMFEGEEGNRKIAAFRISMLDASLAHSEGKDIVAESNSTAHTVSSRTGPAQQAYDWMNGGFVAVDTQEQDWFRFV